MCVKSRKVLARSLEAFQNPPPGGGGGKTGMRSLNREHLKQRVRKIKASAEKIRTTSLLYFNVCSLRLKVTVVRAF